MAIEEPLLETRIIGIIAKILEVDAHALTKESAIGSIPKWDSLNHLKIIFELEASFNLAFDLDDLVEVRSVADCVGLVQTGIIKGGH